MVALITHQSHHAPLLKLDVEDHAITGKLKARQAHKMAESSYVGPRWEFPRIRGPNVDPNSRAVIIMTPGKKAPPTYG